MASSGEAQAKAIVGAGNLHTPDRMVCLDFFTVDNDTRETGPKLAPIRYMSPPISPGDKVLASWPSIEANFRPDDDEPLFLNHIPAERQYPLFGSGAEEPSRNRSQHQEPRIASRAARLGMEKIGPGGIAHPVLYGSSGKQPGLWQNCVDELNCLAAIRRALPDPSKSKSMVEDRDPLSRRQLDVIGQSVGGMLRTTVTKNRTPRKAHRKTVTPEPSASKSSPPIKVALLAKASPPAKIVKSTRRASKAKATVDINFKDFEDRAFPSPAQQTKHKRAAPTKKVVKEDDDQWRNMVNKGPHKDSLDTLSSKPLKVQWKGGPLDITGELDYHELHSQEAEIATALRLYPRQYLANKHRMFNAKFEYVKMGKNFTKTAAQNVTNIDVNKASKLWEAFDRVGWWDEKYFKEALATEDGMKE